MSGHERPPVDVVVPFAGSAEELDDLLGRAATVRVRAGDAVIVADNRAAIDAPSSVGPVRIKRAPDRQSSYYARNRGAADGQGEWILFLDADVEWPPDL